MRLARLAAFGLWLLQAPTCLSSLAKVLASAGSIVIFPSTGLTYLYVPPVTMIAPNRKHSRRNVAEKEQSL
ncbi:hypothetical protein GGR54DRAFT_616663 [Hypoxylon sp. NC1633]|nr:hypothetical protein GGR54DRAFT_616663 [Hypoxylon sp. NC1633]